MSGSPEPIGDGAGAFWPVRHSPAPRLGAVFVHGWGGEHLETWAHKAWFRKRPDGLIDYLWADESLRWRYYSVAHTGAAFQPANIANVASTVGTFLETVVYKEVDAVVLIAHSLGGLACRRLFLNEVDARRRDQIRIFGLLMYGTPNDGTSMARAAGKWLKSKSGEQMATYSEPLSDLNAEWLEHVANGGNPDRDLDERAPLLCWNVVGMRDRVVTSASAAHMSLMGNVRTIAKNHRTLVKPRSSSDLSVGIARDFLVAAEERYENRRRDVVCDRIATQARKQASKAPWVAEEEETIVLEPLPTQQATAFRGKPGLFQCTVTTLRKDVQCTSALNFGVRHDTVSYDSGIEIYSQRSIGDGVTKNVVSLSIRDGIVTDALRGELANVERVTVTHGGNELAFERKDVLTKNTGWFVFPYFCRDFPAGVDRVDSIELVSRSLVDLRMGWYTYVNPNTITTSLLVTFRSPFPVACLMHEPMREQVKSARGQLPESNRIEGAYVTTVRVEAPVAANSRITFVFVSEVTDGSKEGKQQEGVDEEVD